MRAQAAILAFLFVAGIAGCSDDPASPSGQAGRFASARAQWQANRPVRYSFVAVRSCECLPEASGPVRIEVNGTNIVSVTHIHTDAAIDPALWFSVDGLFTLIDDELSARPSMLEAEYDENNGHPTRVEYGEHEVDSGAIIQISDFLTIAGGIGGHLRR